MTETIHEWNSDIGTYRMDQELHDGRVDLRMSFTPNLSYAASIAVQAKELAENSVVIRFREGGDARNSK